MNIAIADDRVEDLQAAEDYLLRYFSARHPEVMSDLSISTFPSAEKFLEVFDPGRFDLLLLDIYMEDMTGMEAAEAVRLKDDRVPIVFLTTSQDHLLEGYRVFASGYLMKPLRENAGEFNHTLDHVFKGLMQTERTITAPVEFPCPLLPSDGRNSPGAPDLRPGAGNALRGRQVPGMPSPHHHQHGAGAAHGGGGIHHEGRQPRPHQPASQERGQDGLYALYSPQVRQERVW